MEKKGAGVKAKYESDSEPLDDKRSQRPTAFVVIAIRL